MSWKEVLKAPMPMSVIEERDTGAKQKIIDFEKNKIEPAFTEYTRNLPPQSPVNLEVLLSGRTGMRGNIFEINEATIKELGGNQKLVFNTIAEIYEKEGYKVNNRPDYGKIVITR